MPYKRLSKAYIGTAGWSLGGPHTELFPAEGSHLARYSSKLTAVEINSSFYRPHRRSTYERWANTVPLNFRFSVKIPKSITHELRLINCDDHFAHFLGDVEGLSYKLGSLLVQLPPSFQFDESIATKFFSMVRRRTDVRIACEPRHPSWFGSAANCALADCGVTRVVADPPICEGNAEPGGDATWAYYRLHGSPIIYRSSYGQERLDRLGDQIARRSGDPIWCIFDNTLGYAAATDALYLQAKGVAVRRHR